MSVQRFAIFAFHEESKAGFEREGKRKGARDYRPKHRLMVLLLTLEDARKPFCMLDYVF